MSRFAVILPAAGKSSRFGGNHKKTLTLLAGKPVWLHSAELFAARADVVGRIVVVAPDDLPDFRARFRDDLARLKAELCPGGAERFDSVAGALERLPPQADLVAIHDAARPCLTAAQIDAVFTRAAGTGAALLAVPVTDTVKRGDEHDVVCETVPRRGLWLAQTPQVFRRDWLLAAYAQRGRLGAAITDDAQLVEAAGHPVHLVPGSRLNIKITTPEDLALAEAILRSRAPASRQP